MAPMRWQVCNLLLLLVSLAAAGAQVKQHPGPLRARQGGRGAHLPTRSRPPWHGSFRPGAVDVRRQRSRVPSAFSVVKAGARIYFDPSARRQEWFRHEYPSWEASTFRVFERFVSADSIVLDVGAWIGPTCLWFAHKARHTVCLEPTQAAFNALRRHKEQNMAYLRADAVHLVNAALGDTKQTARMTNRGDSMDQLALARRRLRRLSTARENLVNVTTISDLERTHPFLSRVTFVKVDTEGFERRIMPALEDSGWLARCKPVLHLSLHPMYTSAKNLERAVNATRRVFPYVWEADMRTPFDFVKHRRSGYKGFEHGGLSLIGTWQQLT